VGTDQVLRGCRLVLGVCAGHGLTDMRTDTWISGGYAAYGSGIRDPGARFVAFFWALQVKLRQSYRLSPIQIYEWAAHRL
jgi:hypothetical protein